MSLAIAVTTIERPQVIQRFVASVRQYHPGTPIYVADQSRDIAAMASFYEAHGVIVVRMPYDAGVTASRNRLVAAMGEDYFLLCDDDFVFGAETRFDEAIAVLDAQPEIGVVGGRLFDFDGAAERPRHWELFFEYDRKNRLLIATPIYHLAPIAQETAGVKFYLCDAVMNFAVFRRSIFDDTVRWDERFKSNGEHEDFYLNLKLNSAVRVAYLPTMTAYHHRSENYGFYHRRLRGRDEGWAEFLRKWELDQHLEIGHGVRSIADVGAVFDAEGARRRFSLDGVPAAARRNYALEPEAASGARAAPGAVPVFFRYCAAPATNADFTLWYRAAPPPRPGSGRSLLPVIVCWYRGEDRVPLRQPERKVLDLADSDYWRALLVALPLVPDGPRVLRFEVETEAARAPLAAGFLLTLDEEVVGEPVAGGDDVLAFSWLNPAELRHAAASVTDGCASVAPAPDPAQPEWDGRLAFADIGRVAAGSLLLFKGWRGLPAALMASRLPGGITDAPQRVALPAAGIAGAAARLDLCEPATGTSEIAPGRLRSIGAIFRSFWPGGPLGLVHRVCLQSFIRHGHVFELYAYDDIDAGPGVVVRDASEILPREEIPAAANAASRAADLAAVGARLGLKVLRDAGGWWCEIATLCLSDTIPQAPYAWWGASLFNCPRGDPLFAELDRRCDPRRVPDMAATLREFGLPPPQLGLTGHAVQPLSETDALSLWLPDFRGEVAAKTATAALVPLLPGRAKQAAIDLAILPPHGSFLADICADYSVDAAEPHYTEAEVIGLYKAWLLDEMEWALPDLLAASGDRIIEYLGLSGTAG